jgi:hypothetical protein
MPKGQTRLKGPITPGTGKAQIAAEGGGKKALKTWRSLPMASRKTLRGSKKLDITAMMKNIRTARVERGVSPAKGNPPSRAKNTATEAKQGRTMAKAYTARADKMGLTKAKKPKKRLTIRAMTTGPR